MTDHQHRRANTLAGVRKIVKRKRLTMPVLLDSEGAVMNEINPRGTLPFSTYVTVKGKLVLRWLCERYEARLRRSYSLSWPRANRRVVRQCTQDEIFGRTRDFTSRTPDSNGT